MVVFVLLVASCIQPLAPVFAAETEDQTPTPAQSEEAVEIAEEIPPEPDVVVEKEIIPEAVEDTTVAEDEPVVDETESDTLEELIVDDDETAEEAATSSPNKPVLDTSASTTPPDVEDDDNANADTTPEVSDEVGETSTSTASSSSFEPRVESVTTNDNYYQFSKDECVRVADGSFYCGAGAAQEPVLEDSFYVALDEDGDSEIFARIDGEVLQVTDNQVTDAAPHYDALSNTLVWHQEVNERYQIMSYDFTTERMSQLTSGRVNNMEPHRYGELTVWQQWGSDSWEIVLHDGETVSALTDDVYADLSPTVREDYVLWRTQYEDTQVVTIYDRTTGNRETIDDADGALALSNPRLMLVFEGVNAAGDRVTKGFDPATGQVMPLTTVPAELPDNIPDSEPTEEVRALVQPKPATEEIVELEEDDTANTATSTPPEESVATSTESTDVVVPPLATSTESVAEESVEPVIETATRSEPVTDIPDLVIPPATSTESV